MASAEQSVVKTLSSSHIRVLAMKLQVPYLPVEYVRRSRGIQQLADANPVRIIEAAPGFGKSSMMAEWLNVERHRGTPVAWLTLDPKENDPARFLLYLFSAVNSVFPDVGADLFAKLETGTQYDDVFVRWMAELSTLAKRDTHSVELILALDDCHHIESPVVQTWLDQLVVYLPEHIHLICSSRKVWHGPLASLETQGRVSCFDEQLLKLNWEETRTWLKVHGAADRTDHQVEQVYKLTEGWLTGLQLMNSCSEHCDPDHFSADAPLLQSYFRETVEDCLDAESLSIYLRVAILKSVSAVYLESVFGIHDADRKLQGLLQQHRFLIRNEHKPSWYRLHPLLARLLTMRVDKVETSRVLVEGSQWLVTQGESRLAIELALQSGDMQKAAELVERTAESILAVHDIAQLLAWKEQLPLSVIGASPRLVVIFSWTLAFAQQVDEAERLMAQIDRFLPLSSSEKNDEVSGQLFSIRGYIARVRGKIDNTIQLSQQALEKLPKSKYVARAVTHFNLSNAYLTQDNIIAAREQNKLSFEMARAAGSVHLEMLALHEHSRIEHVKGNLKVAAKLADEGLKLAEQLDAKETAAAYGRLLIYRGYLYWLSQTFEQAEILLRQGMRIAENCHDAYIIMGDVLFSNIARQQGKTELAYDYINQTEARLQRWRVPGIVYQPWLAVMRVNLLIDEGKVESALASLESLYQQARSIPYILAPEHFPHLKGLVDVFYIRAKALMGEHKEAVKLLDEKVSVTDESQQGFRMIFLYIMRALLRFQLGEENDAIKDFRVALIKAEKEDCLFPFVEYSSGMSSLYKKLPQHLLKGAFIERVLEHVDLDKDEGPNRAFAQVKSVISQRELGVLKLIAQGHSNQEIADKLFISLHTVKTHARRINSKLAVKSRTQAIIKAKEIGLI